MESMVFIVIFVAIVLFFCSTTDDTKQTKYAPHNSELENEIYSGLYNDWEGHKTNDNHFVPPEYVAYMEKNCRLNKPKGYVCRNLAAGNAWECWAYAKTNEILISKGYMGSSMSCLAKYDEDKHERIDYTSHEELYKQFNITYLPLIEFYNETGEYIDDIEYLPSKTAFKQSSQANILNDFRIDMQHNNQITNKLYYDSREILNDIRQQYGESKYSAYNNMVVRDEIANSEEHAFNMLCNTCEKAGLLNIKASEQKFHNCANLLGTWTCYKCGVIHSNDCIMCECGLSKYHSMELEMYDGVEQLLGVEIRKKTQKECESKVEYHGRLYMLNIYYPIYEIVCKALQFENPRDGIRYIYDAGDLHGDVIKAYWKCSDCECTDKKQGLKNLCSTMLTCLSPSFDYQLKAQKQII